MADRDISTYPHTHEAPAIKAELVARLHDILESLGTTAVERLLEDPQLLNSTQLSLHEALQTIQKLAKQSTLNIIPEDAVNDLRLQPPLRILPDSSI